MLDPNKKSNTITEETLATLVLDLPLLPMELLLETIDAGQIAREQFSDFWSVKDEAAFMLYKAEMSRRLGLPEGSDVTYIKAEDLGVDLFGKEDQNQNYMEN